MDWDKLYIKHPEFCIKEPAKEIVDFIPILKKLPGTNSEKKIYDLGFGAGRHVIYLAKQGFDVYGDDISLSGLEITRQWLKKERLSAKLGISDMTKIPYPDDFFDAIINRGVITHNTKNGIGACIKEMYKKLKNGGKIIVTFISTESSEYGKGEKIAENTFIPTEGPEKGVIHHFVDSSEVEELMKDFKKISLYKYRHKGLLKIGNYISAHWIYVGEK